MTPLDGPLGASLSGNGTRFDVYAPDATAVWLCLFDERDAESRIDLQKSPSGIWTVHVKGVSAGQRYGLRADGRYAPALGHWFDPVKLLIDPFATRIDREFRTHRALSAQRGAGTDTAALVPKAIVEAKTFGEVAIPSRFEPGGLIYELNVRAFTMLHPDIPVEERGTLRAISHPAALAHLKKLGIDAVELMPVVAWIDEGHLPDLGLANGWGYNPVTFMAVDPRLAPGGIADLAAVTSALRAEGISVILDLVFNHTGESDFLGPVLSLRGLANNQSYMHDDHHRMINDTGTGNTLNSQHPFVICLLIESLRHFVVAGGVDGFRFDLATVLGRSRAGFDSNAAMLEAILADAVLKDRVMIAEPWDVGPGGYQLGNFPEAFLEWNDRYRDTIRKFWRGDRQMLGDLATALAGSSTSFTGRRTRSINFIAAHDGFTLADLVSHERKHNEANGEDNNDGHDENFSWNNGEEGKTNDPVVTYARKKDIIALLALLFASRGTIMLTAGDAFGRSQQGNNNAYCQDNELTWIDWQERDTDLETYASALSRIRKDWPHLTETTFLTGNRQEGLSFSDVAWLAPSGQPMTTSQWECENVGALVMILAHPHQPDGPRLAVLINRLNEEVRFELPERAGYRWHDLVNGSEFAAKKACIPRSVTLCGEMPIAKS